LPEATSDGAQDMQPLASPMQLPQGVSQRALSSVQRLVLPINFVRNHKSQSV